MLFCVNRFIYATLLIGLGLTLSSVPATAQAPRLEISLSNEYIDPAASTGWLTAYIRNPIDSVAGFKIWMQFDRPDVIAFVPTTPSPLLDYDTTGSVFSDWGFDVRSVSGTPFDVQVVSIVPPPGRGIGPSSSLRQLIRIPFVVLPGANELPDPIARVFVQAAMPELFNFSTPDGTTIPWADTVGGVPVIDTVKIKVRPGSVQIACIADGDLNGDGLPLTVADLVYTMRVFRGNVDAPDSLYRVDFNGDCVIDYIDDSLYQCLFTFGMFCLPQYPMPTCCNPELRICCQGMTGNVDCDPAGAVDIADISALIDNLYLSFSLLCCHAAANLDGDPGRGVDISDLSALIDYLYITFAPPAACF